MRIVAEITAAILGQLQQPSTVVGLITLGTMLCGWIISPDHAASIATVTSSVASVALTVVQERDRNDRGNDDGDHPC